MDDAIAFEKALTGKSRAKKVALIEETNLRWNDVAWDWVAPEEHPGSAGESASRGDSE
jgi:hypothetical protein